MLLFSADENFAFVYLFSMFARYNKYKAEVPLYKYARRFAAYFIWLLHMLQIGQTKRGCVLCQGRDQDREGRTGPSYGTDRTAFSQTASAAQTDGMRVLSFCYQYSRRIGRYWCADCGAVVTRSISVSFRQPLFIEKRRTAIYRKGAC